MTQAAPNKRLLVFNCHEAWVYQLSHVGYPLDIVVGLRGRHKAGWDEQIRPVPSNSRLITLSEARQSTKDYYCIITHNITDLLDIAHRPEPRLNVIHLSIEARMREESCTVPAEAMALVLQRYMALVGGHVVAVSRLKGESWGFVDDIVTFCADPADYLPFTGRLACGLRIANWVNRRRQFLLWSFHEKAFLDIPVRLVGYNPGMPAVSASQSWAHLKQLLQSHRFYVHTADPTLEDGYNMATVEAMAAGMPILSNAHPGTAVEHGVSGFVSDDPAELRHYAVRLLNDPALAAQLGREARRIACQRFGVERFRQAIRRSIETARYKVRLRQCKLARPSRVVDLSTPSGTAGHLQPNG